MLLAILPAIVLMVYIYRKDKVEHEPFGLLMKLLVGGMLVTVPVSLIELGLTTTLGQVFRTPESITYLLVENYLVVALFEELGKFCILMRAWKHQAFDHVFDAIVYAVFVSLGFALLENILYVFSGQTYAEGIGIALGRAVFSVPSHMFFSIFMGLFFGRAKVFEARGQKLRMRNARLLAVLAPLLVHGTDDFLLSLTSDGAWYAWIALIIVLYIAAFLFIRKSSKGDLSIAEAARTAERKEQGYR